MASYNNQADSPAKLNKNDTTLPIEQDDCRTLEWLRCKTRGVSTIFYLNELNQFYD